MRLRERITSSEARRKGVCLEQVVGIGGVFFKARDPKALAAWYREHLGVPVEPEHTYGAFTSAAAGEQAVWSAFPADTSYFGSGPAPFMVNYRVRNLDAMLAQLRAAGAQVDDRVEDYDFGRFGWATDPEGNRFELWEPRPPGQGYADRAAQKAEGDRGGHPGFSSFNVLAGGPGSLAERSGGARRLIDRSVP